MRSPDLDRMKAQAKALRRALKSAGTPVSHAQALELLAQQHGARDWNTLHARLSCSNAPPELALGDRIAGRYLGQPIAGTVVALSGPASHRTIELHLDQPVDVVVFEGFSNWRQRIRATIDETGRSHRCTSDGVPQLVVQRA